jgi:hypothetical protein
MIAEIEVFKPTKDDWYGSYQLDGYYHGIEKQMFVEVTFNGNISAPGEVPNWRKCAGGSSSLKEI